MRIHVKKLFLPLAICLLCTSAVADTESPDVPQLFLFESYVDLEGLFEQLGYTEQSWQEGIREVPRLYLAHIPERWRSTRSKEVTVQKKKALFFRLLGPLALRANELIAVDRRWLLSEARHDDEDRLAAFYSAYRVAPGDYEELLQRVDVIPCSLILAQAAEESGWGTSRFAAAGNALFGQWTYGKGIKPLEQRAEKGDYKIAAFASPLDSVRAYMQNLNSHPAYQSLRDERARARQAGNPASGYELAQTLTRYSERGEGYVHSLHAIMRVNKLAPTDNAYLSKGQTTILRPSTPR